MDNIALNITLDRNQTRWMKYGQNGMDRLNSTCSFRDSVFFKKNNLLLEPETCWISLALIFKVCGQNVKV